MTRVTQSDVNGLFTSKFARADGSREPLVISYRSRSATGYLFSRDDIRRSTAPPGVRPALPYQAISIQPGVIGMSYSYNQTTWTTWSYSGFGDYVHDTVFRIPPLPSGVTAAMQNEALVRALNQLANLKWNAAVALAEGRESVKQITHAAATLDRVFVSLGQNRYTRAARQLGVSSKLVTGVKTSAEAWLALQFGWKPVVEDLAQAALTLADIPRRMRLKGASQVRYQGVDVSSPSTITSPDSYMSWSAVFTTESVREAKVSLWYELTSASAVRLKEYGITNQALALWAVAPSSYLVDWVLPISDILSAMEASFGLTFLSGSCTSYVRATTTFKAQPIGLGPGSVLLDQSCVPSSDAESMSMARTVYNGDPKPSVTAMYVKDPFDLWKAVTSLSLLASRKL